MFSNPLIFSTSLILTKVSGFPRYQTELWGELHCVLPTTAVYFLVTWRFLCVWIVSWLVVLSPCSLLLLQPFNSSLVSLWFCFQLCLHFSPCCSFTSLPPLWALGAAGVDVGEWRCSVRYLMCLCAIAGNGISWTNRTCWDSVFNFIQSVWTNAQESTLQVIFFNLCTMSFNLFFQVKLTLYCVAQKVTLIFCAGWF